jgi:hypothetical protein
MKRRWWALAAAAVVAIAAYGGYLLLRGDGRREGRFPELRPALDALPGYAWEFRDGPDFYTWVMAEGKKVGRRHRSGIGIYFGHHPNLSAAEGAAERAGGRVCGKKVTWMVDRSTDAADPWVRRDAVLSYDHGEGFQTITLHVWVWAQSEKQVAELTEQLEALSFSPR